MLKPFLVFSLNLKKKSLLFQGSHSPTLWPSQWRNYRAPLSTLSLRHPNCVGLLVARGVDRYSMEEPGRPIETDVQDLRGDITQPHVAPVCVSRSTSRLVAKEWYTLSMCSGRNLCESDHSWKYLWFSKWRHVRTFQWRHAYEYH